MAKGFLKKVRNRAIATAIAGGIGIWYLESNGVNVLPESSPRSSSPDASEAAFGAAIHEEVGKAATGGAFDGARFKYNQKTFWITKGGIEDGALTILREAGIEDSTPQQTADAYCALELATTGKMSDGAAAKYNFVGEPGNLQHFTEAGKLCLQGLVLLNEAGGLGSGDDKEPLRIPRAVAG